MKKILKTIFTVIITVGVVVGLPVIAARTDNLWTTTIDPAFIKTTQLSGWSLLINGSSKYINFNTTTGSSGYGFRDNAGSMEFKNSGGSWTGIGAGGGGITDPGSNGWLVRTALNTTVARTFVASTGIGISNTTGVGGNPTFTNTGVTSYNGLTGAVGGVSTFNSQNGGIQFNVNPSMYLDESSAPTYELSNERVLEISSDYSIAIPDDHGRVFNNRGAGGSLMVVLPNANDDEGAKYSLVQMSAGVDFCFQSPSSDMFVDTLTIPASSFICSSVYGSTITMYAQRDGWFTRQLNGSWHYQP